MQGIGGGACANHLVQFYYCSLGRRWRHLPSIQAIRQLAVYAFGEGWTGALGTGRLDQDIPGHWDEEEESIAPLQPVYSGPVRAVAVGWGHTAILTDQYQLLVAGRPHDFSSLLRLRRAPKWMRNYLVRQTISTSMNHRHQQDDPSLETKSNDSWNATELVGDLVTRLSAFVSPTSNDWETARHQSMLPTLTSILPTKPTTSDDDDHPVAIACSAGFSAYITRHHGHLYTFGLNEYGQCGIGESRNNVWQPTQVTGLNSDFATIPRAEMEQSFPITQVALGLQHGVCLNNQGEMFCWGKGERGQLGQGRSMMESHTALPVKRAVSLDTVHAEVKTTAKDTSRGNLKPKYEPVGKVLQIAVGMIHSAALTVDNRVLIWGKNMLPPFGDDVGKKSASDALLPLVLSGLNPQLKVEKIACGSHHTAVLLEDGSVWAVGISSDTSEPMHEPTMLIPPGVVEMPVRQFGAHMDRTTVVGSSGRQVLQVSLWKDKDLQEFAAFTPSWLDRILQSDERTRIREVHRGWLHSVVVTDFDTE
jgi:alpha-tubulin suppressor-like RCC1 family protein